MQVATAVLKSGMSMVPNFFTIDQTSPGLAAINLRPQSRRPTSIFHSVTTTRLLFRLFQSSKWLGCNWFNPIHPSHVSHFCIIPISMHQRPSRSSASSSPDILRHRPFRQILRAPAAPSFRQRWAGSCHRHASPHPKAWSAKWLSDTACRPARR